MAKNKDFTFFCQGCLTSERKLLPVADMLHVFQDISFWEIKSLEGGLCWECHKILVKFMRFKAQVRFAQEALYSVHNMEDLKSLSSLTVATQTTSLKYTYAPDPLLGVKPEILKIEPLNYGICDEKDSDDDYKGDEVRNSHNECKPESQFSEVKPVVSGQGITMVNQYKEPKIKLEKNMRKKENIKMEGYNENGDFMKKFNSIVLTEEEMQKCRDKKRNQPNYKAIKYKCDTCVLGFSKLGNFQSHMRKKHDESLGPHICLICARRFPTDKQQELHTQTHYTFYKCLKCKKRASDLKTIWAHYRTKHLEDTEEQKHCRSCDFVATSLEELSEHVSTYHCIPCTVCGETFKTPSSMKSHMKRIHKERDYSCEFCPRTFKTASRLESHTARHSDIEAKKLAYCSTCNIQYKNLYVYRNHLRTSPLHVNQVYECLECNRNFASKAYWKKHYSFYHLRKSEYRCELCNKLFISKFKLRSHRETQHGQSRSRNHSCNVCGKLFYTIPTLKVHQLTHSEERSFMCSECGDTFKQRSSLYTHIRLVHKGLKRK